jgi:signal transduction histidine kinase
VESPPTNAQRIAAYRVVQEALSNASRHAGTREQWVSLVVDDEDCVVTIRDDGKGFDTAAPVRTADRRPRLGLQGMRERIELLGGEFAVKSSPGQGTTVTARIPLMGAEG